MSPRAVYALSLLLAASALGAPSSPQVLARYRQMLAVNPVEGTALDRLWKAYTENGQTAQLLAEYEAGQTFAERMIFGLLQHRAGREAAAAAAFQAAAGLDARSPLPYDALATLRTAQARPAEAAAEYEQALALLPPADPRLVETLTNLGRAWLAAGELEKASAAWEKTVALDPANTELRRRLAETYRDHRLPQRALPHLEYVAAHAPTSERAAALQEISRLHQSLRQPDEAIRALEQAVALTAPGSWLWGDLQGQLIRLHQRFGRSAELEERWRQQVAQSPRDLGGLLQLHELYERVGDLEGQRSTLEKLIGLAPKNAGYRVQLARLLVTLNRPGEAAKLYDVLLEEQPGQADLVFERASLEIQEGATAQAHTRLAAWLARPGTDEALRNRAIEFYREHRLWPEAEALLVAEAAAGSEEPVLALAHFYFAQHREADGEKTLRRLLPHSGSSRVRASALLHMAQLLKGQNQLPETIRALAEALPLAAGDLKQQREIALLLAEIQATRGELEASRQSCLAALQASQTPAEQEAAELRLFETLRQLPEGEGSAAEKVRLAEMAGRARAEEEPGLAKANPLLADYIAQLAAAAQAAPSEAAWLRVARWRAWCHDVPAAMEDIGRALALNEQSLAAHEAAVSIGFGNAGPVATRWHLEALQRLDPARATGYRRRLAELDLQAGNMADAIHALAELARESPGQVDLLVDLAQAQQRAERWGDALETWKTIQASSPAGRKREATAPLLRIYERLHQPQPAAELLLAQFDAQSEPKEQLETGKELLTLCEKEGLLPWLRTRWEARRQERLDDYPGEIVYAQILQAQGDGAAAFQALSEALYTAPNPADALPELVRQAEELRRLEAAIDFQGRLVRLGPQGRPDALLKLAELQERNFAIAAAEGTWEQALGRFPRDVAVRQGAADFHLRGGEERRAAGELRRVRELEPTDTRTLFKLARLDVREGELAEAEACLEQILRTSPAEESPSPIRFPALKREDASELQATYLRAVRQRRSQPTAEMMKALRGFWVESPAENKSEDDLRLNAIRELALLTRAKEDPAALRTWIARWQAAGEGAAGESLWALFYAQAGEATLQFVEQLLRKEPANVQYQQGYIWMALQLREFTRLAAWLDGRRRTASERDYVRIALSQYLQATVGYFDPELLRALAATASPARRWELAQLCAANSCFAEAVQLGREVMAQGKGASPLRALELAQWELAAGEPARAQQRFAEMARQPGESLEAPPYTALRMAYLLLPERERPAYGQRVERELAQAPPLHAALSRVVLHGLLGRDVRAEVRLLVQMRPLAALGADEIGSALESRTKGAERSWEFLSATGVRLQAWGLWNTAQLFWEETLADGALTRLQGEQAEESAREIRLSLLALRLARAGRDDVAPLVAASLRGDSENQPGAALGESLESLGAVPRAAEVLYQMWQREPANGQIVRDLLNDCRSLDDTETAEKVLQVCVGQRLFALNDNTQREYVTQLADLLERRGAFAEARQLLAEAVRSSPYDTRLLQRLAQSAEKAGNRQEAEAQWRRLLSTEPSHIAGRLGLATLLQASDRMHEAIGLLKKGPAAGVEAKLAELLYAAGDVDEAMSTVERVHGTERLAAPLALARAMLAHGDRSHARALLQSAVARTTDPAAAMSLQSLLVESLVAPAEADLITRELVKLREIAGDDGARLGVYFSFVQSHAASLGILERAQRELADAWAEGAGLLPAGLVVLSWTLDTEMPKAERVLKQILPRPDVGERWLQVLLPSLVTARRPDLAAQVEERLFRLNPADSECLLSCVRNHVASGHPERAETLLQAWGPRARVDEAAARNTAQAWLALGQLDRAQELLMQIASPRGFLRSYEPYLEHARLRLGRGDFGPAKALLLLAFEHPGNRQYAAIAEWLRATNQLAAWEKAVVEFRFSSDRLREVGQAVAAELAKPPAVAGPVMR